MFLHEHLGHLPLPGRLYSFLDRTSLIAAFSSASSAYMRLSFAFSASSSFIRFSSETDTPPYLPRQLKYVARLMRCLRVSSSIETPASPSFKIATIYDSVNLDFLMGLSRSAGKVYYSAVSEAGELTKE